LFTKFEIARLLQEKIDIASLKSDSHVKGVWFTDNYGVVLNKVMGIKIKHSDSFFSESLFYSFVDTTDDGSALVCEAYPFVDMLFKPKKHHLLFTETDVREKRLKDIFQIEPYEIVTWNPKEIDAAIPEITNKRLREKTILRVRIESDISKLSCFVHTKNIKNAVKEASIKNIYQEGQGVSFFSINAFNLKAVLQLLSCYNTITLKISRNKIVITGDDHQEVEIVLAIMK